MNKGKFIVFEGVDCSGKSSIIASIEKKLNSNVFFTKEPYGTDIKNNIREIIKKSLENNDEMTTMLAFALERAYHIKNYIIPQLNQGKTVISDRFFISTLVYQGDKISKNLLEEVYQITNHSIIIDCIFFCNINPKEASNRMKQRKDNNFLDTYYSERMEELSMSYQKILSQYNNVTILDMSLPIAENTKIVLNKIFALESLADSDYIKDLS